MLLDFILEDYNNEASLSRLINLWITLVDRDLDTCCDEWEIQNLILIIQKVEK